MKYLIKSTKGYWLEKGHGYTQSQNEAYAFTLEEMLHLGFNLDGCTLLNSRKTFEGVSLHLCSAKVVRNGKNTPKI